LSAIINGNNKWENQTVKNIEIQLSLCSDESAASKSKLKRRQAAHPAQIFVAFFHQQVYNLG
jgi:hypothetical protein